MKELSQLLQSIDVIEVIGDTHREISGIVSDSRCAAKDMMFVAVRGVNVDGHQYIPQLNGKGLCDIIC